MNQDIINERLDLHEKRLDKCENKVDNLEKDNVANSTKILELCKSLDGLTSGL